MPSPQPYQKNIPSKETPLKEAVINAPAPPLLPEEAKAPHSETILSQELLQAHERNKTLELQVQNLETKLQQQQKSQTDEYSRLLELVALSKKQKEELSRALIQEYTTLLEQYETTKRTHLLELKTLYKVHQKEGVGNAHNAGERDSPLFFGHNFAPKSPLGQLLYLKAGIKKFERSLEEESILPSCEALIMRKLQLIFEHFPTIPWLLFSLSTNRFEAWSQALESPPQLDEKALKQLQEETGELPIHFQEAIEGTLLAIDPLKNSPFRLFIHARPVPSPTQSIT